MNKVLFLVIGLAILLLAGCAQKTDGQATGGKTASPAPTAPPQTIVGDGDQSVSDDDAKAAEDDEDLKELEKLTGELG